MKIIGLLTAFLFAAVAMPVSVQTITDGDTIKQGGVTFDAMKKAALAYDNPTDWLSAARRSAGLA